MIQTPWVPRRPEGGEETPTIPFEGVITVWKTGTPVVAYSSVITMHVSENDVVNSRTGGTHQLGQTRTVRPWRPRWTGRAREVLAGQGFAGPLFGLANAEWIGASLACAVRRLLSDGCAGRE
jgi:hypothetical protein